jgi:DNA-binding transcriptional LysR family regulator
MPDMPFRGLTRLADRLSREPKIDKFARAVPARVADGIASKMININPLRLFVKVAETESISAAARQLDIAPSIASRQISALERAFKTKLLTRTTRRLSLTPAGATLLEWARSTVEGYEEVSDELGAMQQRPSGIIRLASNDYAAVTYLPSILQKFCTRYPEVRIQLSTSNDPSKLLASVYDLAIHAGRMPEANLIGRSFRQYRRRLCATPAYLNQKGKPRTPADLAGHDCLTHAASERLHWSFEHEGEIVTQSIEPYFESDNYLVLKELVLKGVGIARLAEELVHEAIAAGTLVEVLPNYKCVYADGALPAMWMVFADRRILRRTRLLADFIIEELANW